MISNGDIWSLEVNTEIGNWFERTFYLIAINSSQVYPCEVVLYPTCVIGSVKALLFFLYAGVERLVGLVYIGIAIPAQKIGAQRTPLFGLFNWECVVVGTQLRGLL